VSANQTQTKPRRRSKRSTYEISQAILNILQEPRKKTQVMYSANLSYDLTVSYLNKLQELGLATASDDGFYTITDKGRQVLDLLNQYVQTKKQLDQLTAKLSEIFPKTQRPGRSKQNQN
jgi:predicted transcriptional regulator